MSSRRIENPILNSPFDAPTRHFRFDQDGITDEIVEGRRPSQYFMPVPAAKKKAGAQQELSYTEQSVDRIEETKFVNELRERVDRWRQLQRPYVTGTTKRLLEYWTDPDRERKLFFAPKHVPRLAPRAGPCPRAARPSRRLRERCCSRLISPLGSNTCSSPSEREEQAGWWMCWRRTWRGGGPGRRR